MISISSIKNFVFSTEIIQEENKIQLSNETIRNVIKMQNNIKFKKYKICTYKYPVGNNE